MGKPDEATAQAAQPGRHAGDPARAPLGATRAALESAPTLAGAVEPVVPQASSADALLATLDPATAQESATDESRVRLSPAAEPGVPPRVGRYVVLRQLGAGGMGVVYSAYDPELDRKVAVKVVRDGVQQRSLGRARVLQEAQAMARVSHPNVVHVYEVGEDPTAQAGRVFIAMEFVPGTSLHSWQQAHPLRDPESLDTCLRLYLQAAAGLAAAHQSGLIHRDFKPENVPSV